MYRVYGATNYFGIIGKIRRGRPKKHSAVKKKKIKYCSLEITERSFGRLKTNTKKIIMYPQNPVFSVLFWRRHTTMLFRAKWIAYKTSQSSIRVFYIILCTPHSVFIPLRAQQPINHFYQAYIHAYTQRLHLVINQNNFTRKRTAKQNSIIFIPLVKKLKTR